MLEKLPHKNLFYFGFIVVFIFIGLSYWQLSRYQQDKQIIDSIDSKEIINENGWVFPSKNYKKLTETIVKVIGLNKNKEFWNKIRSRCRSSIKNNLCFFTILLIILRLVLIKFYSKSIT